MYTFFPYFLDSPALIPERLHLDAISRGLQNQYLHVGSAPHQNRYFFDNLTPYQADRQIKLGRRSVDEYVTNAEKNLKAASSSGIQLDDGRILTRQWLNESYIEDIVEEFEEYLDDWEFRLDSIEDIVKGVGDDYGIFTPLKNAQANASGAGQSVDRFVYDAIFREAREMHYFDMWLPPER